MICKISCSFGELVDKITILNIKKSKTQDIKVLEHIENELSAIKCDNPIGFDDLFDQLYIVNQKLWDLEDSIRKKSTRKEFDGEYIHCAEEIHIQNDIRYKIKKKINEKYNSYLKEEKIYHV